VIMMNDRSRIGHMIAFPAWKSSMKDIGLPSGFVSRNARGRL